jgi:hypothetical protein
VSGRLTSRTWLDYREQRAPLRGNLSMDRHGCSAAGLLGWQARKCKVHTAVRPITSLESPPSCQAAECILTDADCHSVGTLYTVDCLLVLLAQGIRQDYHEQSPNHRDTSGYQRLTQIKTPGVIYE